MIAKGSWTGQTAGDGLIAAGFAEPTVTALNHGGIGGCGFVEPFPSAQPLLALGLSGLAVGDLDGDGNDDTVVSDFSTDLLLVSLQNAEAGFGLFNGFVGGDGPRGPTLADFNQDGKLDVAVADGVTETVAVALGNGTFGAPVRISEGAGLTNVSVGDVNGDGRDDVLIAYQGTAGSVEALFSRGDGSRDLAVVSNGNPGAVTVLLGVPRSSRRGRSPSAGRGWGRRAPRGRSRSTTPGRGRCTFPRWSCPARTPGSSRSPPRPARPASSRVRAVR